ERIHQHMKPVRRARIEPEPERRQRLVHRVELTLPPLADERPALPETHPHPVTVIAPMRQRHEPETPTSARLASPPPRVRHQPIPLRHAVAAGRNLDRSAGRKLTLPPSSCSSTGSLISGLGRGLPFALGVPLADNRRRLLEQGELPAAPCPCEP